MKTKIKNRTQSLRSVERVRRAAVAQNNREAQQWTNWVVDRLQYVISLLRRRASALGIPLVESFGSATAPESSPDNRFYALRGVFWNIQAQLAHGLSQNEEVSSECIMDIILAKSRLAQLVRFDFGGHGLKTSAMDIPSVVKRIAAQVAVKRKDKGLTQAALGEAIGMSAANVARIESGERRLSIVALYQIAEALEVDISNLIAKEILFHTDVLSMDQIQKIEAALPALVRALQERKKELQRKGG